MNAVHGQVPTTERIRRGGLTTENKHLDTLALTYRKNISSGHTADMVRMAEAFEYENQKHLWWNPEECSLLYGSDLWRQCTEQQRLALNHLYWCCFYNMVAGAETSATVWNEVAAGAFFNLPGYDIVCHELDLETTQERHHIRCFNDITFKTEMALFGEIIFSRDLPHWTQAAVNHPQATGRQNMIAHIPGHMITAWIGSSPFVATQYFTGRGLRNVAGRIKEGRFAKYARARQKAGDETALPSLVSHYHFLDEAFHTATSNVISHNLVDDFRDAGTHERMAANSLILGVQIPDQTLSAAVPVMFRDDSRYMPGLYRMLRSKLFSLDHGGALEVLETCLCRETEALHVSEKCMEETRRDGQEYLSSFDYLWPINTGLKFMGRASIPRALERNRESLKAFKSSLQGATPQGPALTTRVRELLAGLGG